GGRFAAALFHGPLVCAARGMRLDFLRRAVNDVNPPAIRLPAGDPRRIVVVGVRNAAVVLFLKLVLFGVRRGVAPDTEENEFKEEHYRRIAYANDHYASGIPGWKSDRGRIYIIYGPAEEIESHPAGGTYERPMEEGGGETSTFPFEQWRYRYLEGIGQEVIIEFVDS